jgi:hypothetical protein
VTRIPPPDGDDQAAIDAYIAEVWRASDAGELLEEIPWDAEEEALLAEAWDELDAELKQEAAVRVAERAEHAAIAQRRRERRRRRAWRMPPKDGVIPAPI